MITCQGIEQTFCLPCSSTDLIESHIVPRAFLRDMMGKQKNNKLITRQKVRSVQHGLADWKLLCKTCDGFIGKHFDEYVIELARTFDPNKARFPDNGTFILPDVDGDAVAKFAVSVIWRASISSLPELEEVKIGLFEDVFRKIIFGVEEFSAFPNVGVFVARYVSDKIAAKQVASYPFQRTLHNRHAWAFSAGGFLFSVLADSRPVPSEHRSYMVNGQDRLVGSIILQEFSPESITALEAAIALKLRDQGK